MEVEETRIFTERGNNSPGAHIQAVATAKGVGMNVTTQSCWIVVPGIKELIKGVIVTRNEDK